MVHCEHCDIDLPDETAACPRCGSALAVEHDELLGREVLGRYRIVRMLAEGGMGRVYVAEQSVGTVVRRVAVKVLRRGLGSDRQLVSRFSREAETLVRLTHPNTVQLFDFGTLPDGTLALVMEYVEGHSLARELLKGALSATRAERLLTQACGALQEAHAHGIVHRDLKPDNLLIAERVGHGDFLKVLDFGIAKASSENDAAHTKLTQQGMIIGTPPYMSPEQFSGDAIDGRSDIYSLGVIAYEMLTARLPFAAKTPWEWASKHLTQEPEHLPLSAASGLLPRHARAIREALAKRADDCPPTVAEFLARFTSDGAASTDLAAAAGQRASKTGGDTRSASAAPHAAASGRSNRGSARDAERDSSSDATRASDAGPSGDSSTLSGISSTLSATLSAQFKRPGGRAALFGGMLVALLLAGFLMFRGAVREPRLPPQLVLPNASASSAPANLAGGSSALPEGAAIPDSNTAQAARPHHHASHADDVVARAHERHQKTVERVLGNARGGEQAAHSEADSWGIKPWGEPPAQVQPAQAPSPAQRSAPEQPNDDNTAVLAAASEPGTRGNTRDAPPDARRADTSARRPAPSVAAPAPSRESTPAPASSVKRPAPVPDDLAQRVYAIQSAASTRVEMAVGLYQAAAGRYPSNPALEPARAQLASSGDKRVRELIGGGRCAQAQALFRALRAISATAKAASAFTGSCPLPP